MAAATAQSVQRLVQKFSKVNKNLPNLYNIPEEKFTPQDALATMIDNVLDEYARNPNAALEICCKQFGRERFQNSLRVYIHQHVAKTAMQLAMKRCFEQEHKNV